MSASRSENSALVSSHSPNSLIPHPLLQNDPAFIVSKIKPQTLKGFRDFLPETMLSREHLMQTARDVYRSFGFAPIDTPALEYTEILLGKGGDESDKQMFRFTDQGNRDVSMRFDLTVPFARFAAQHLNELGTPFKRYHMGAVWRAEKPQKGRYREFVQCDFDTIGTSSNAADIETLMVIHELMDRIACGEFTIRVNNRKVLNGLLEKLDLTEQSVNVLRALDKLPKIGREKVLAEMTEQAGIDNERAAQVLDFAGLSGTTEELLTQVGAMVAGNETGETGVAQARELFDVASSAGLPAQRLQLDLSIARGLDYYTGTIYETFLADLPGIGSVCSGGRYDNLAELFTSQPLPGVGASLGLDRLLAALEELGKLETASTPTQVLVTIFDPAWIADSFRIARQLRKSGLAVEVYADHKKLGKQFQYADKKGIPIALVAGEEERATGSWQVKDLRTGDQSPYPEAELAGHLAELLAKNC
ncbi:MAG: histidine--tRNA ligase [Planctomycetaceae bacterium]|nr:histidine--tRNA ligase [Planctomycetaceae bacterium]